MVEYLAAELVRAGRFPLVLTRGYGDDEHHQTRAALGADGAVLVGANRYDAACSYLVAHPHALASGRLVGVLDDGLQHLALARDVDVLMIDASRPAGAFGNGALIPHGSFREPLADGVARSHVVVLHGSGGDVSSVEALCRQQAKPLVRSAFAAERLRIVHDAPARPGPTLALSGIESPAAFQATVRAVLRPAPVQALPHADHFAFTANYVERLVRTHAPARIVVTAKDWWRSGAALTQVAREAGVALAVLEGRLVFASAADEGTLRGIVFRALGLAGA